MESREIKALSAEDIAGLKAGRGMSMALPAELNGYPGPLHVLELAEPLALSDEQRRRTQELYERMRAAAVSAGEALITSEAQLDRLFATRTATPEALNAALAAVAQAQARVRGTHLQAHLEQVRILTPVQVAQYNRLRGYRIAQGS
jgi:Spy/CpxP family protein refolding chaperone